MFFLCFFLFFFFILKPWQIQPLEIVPLFGLSEDTVSAGSSNDHVGESRHVNAVADNLMRMFDEEDENREEEEENNFDEMMETESERRQRYLNSELCECSDPDEWMAYHHGSDSDGS